MSKRTCSLFLFASVGFVSAFCSLDSMTTDPSHPTGTGDPLHVLHILLEGLPISVREALGTALPPCKCRNRKRTFGTVYHSGRKIT